MDKRDRIDYDNDGKLDDVVICGVSMFRMEAMGDGRWWIKLYREGGKDEVFWLSGVTDARHYSEHASDQEAYK
ncbi:MAG: hypothetical protein E6Q97_03495 [Desulfurellales bacterium]|nr:MAG: hypothetical protein E6Q97_03495 [Desulfurellales bacterium]